MLIIAKGTRAIDKVEANNGVVGRGWAWQITLNTSDDIQQSCLSLPKVISSKYSQGKYKSSLYHLETAQRL